MKMVLNEPWQQLLLAGMQRLDIALSDAQMQCLGQYLAELDQYNQHTNLVSKSDPLTLVREHVLDALSLVPIIQHLKTADAAAFTLVDIGSGAGFPALVLAIVLEQLQLDMIESVGKKTRFLSQVSQSLGIASRVRVHNDRAEELAHQAGFRGRFDFATARAVGKVDLICELTVPLLRESGYLLAQKSSQQLLTELSEAKAAMAVLGCSLAETVTPDKTALGKDVVVALIKKEKATPPRLPRSAAQLKKPLA